MNLHLLIKGVAILTEHILIMAVKKADQDERQFKSSLGELVSLSQTAGGTVEKIVTQNRQNIHPATYIGEGKVNEIKQLIEEHKIDLVISNDELSPGQLRNLGERLDQIPIIDRNQLILDIFAQRAKTREGQLQVELAQLEYTLPRLYGQGLVLSRLGGGIGTRGPGETKLETDQRHIRRKIVDIKRRLDTVVKQREQYRKRRKQNNVFQIAIVGYTNAGKSTIFNRLTDESALEENLLFATLDPLTRKIHLPSGFQCLITDTVGFLQDLPTSLIAAFKSTLEEVTEADFLIHVVDAANEDNEQHEKTVYQILKELHAHTIPMLTVYNKKDLLKTEFIAMNHPSILLSAYDKKDINQLIILVEKLIKEQWMHYQLAIHTSKGGTIYKLGQQTIVTGKQYNEETNKYEIEGFIAHNHPLQYLLKE